MMSESHTGRQEINQTLKKLQMKAKGKWGYIYEFLMDMEPDVVVNSESMHEFKKVILLPLLICTTLQQERKKRKKMRKAAPLKLGFSLITIRAVKP